jgi:hypothetical protein
MCHDLVEPMNAWDINKLAKEIERVVTVRLGWYLRSDANTDQLRLLARTLTGEVDSDDFQLYEVALRPSIERLGRGPVARLAQIMFGLTEESENVQFVGKRREIAIQKLGIKPNAIEGQVHKMCLAIARDLIIRWEKAGGPDKKASVQPATSTPKWESDPFLYFASPTRVEVPNDQGRQEGELPADRPTSGIVELDLKRPARLKGLDDLMN